MTRLGHLKQSLRAPAHGPIEDRLRPLDRFGTNPGALEARLYLPSGYSAGGALVVVLHGCTQTAAGYDFGAGWSRLADEQGFALLFPQQQRANNPNLCFNWFSAEDASRGRGEALSIRQMIDAVQARHGTDPGRVFVTGLSAGGAMTAVMLATYPEVFAGGGVIAGLPYGTARSVPEAFDRMRGSGIPEAAELARLVRVASPRGGPWPTLSVWHGDADATVDPSNATALIEQWRILHGAEAASPEDRVEGYPYRCWRDRTGRAVVEEYRITGLGHGTPIDTRGNENAGPFLLDAGISSTRRLAEFWGICGSNPERAETRATLPLRPESPGFAAKEAPVHAQTGPGGAQKVIEDALRSAGLLR